MKTLFVNIKELIQVRDTGVKKVSGKAMNSLPTIKNAFLLIENDRIIDFGKMEQLPNRSVANI